MIRPNGDQPFFFIHMIMQFSRFFSFISCFLSWLGFELQVVRVILRFDTESWGGYGSKRLWKFPSFWGYTSRTTEVSIRPWDDVLGVT